MKLFSTEVYAPSFFIATINNLGFEHIGTYLPFTPITTLYYYPFTFFDPFVAKVIFNFISIVLFIYTLIRFFKFLNLNTNYLLLMPILFFVPLINGILFGQFYILLFVLITESFMLYDKRKWLSAMLLGIAISIKIFPILLIFLFIKTKDFKQIFRLFIVGFLLFSVSIYINGFSIWEFYFIEIFKPSLSGIMGLDYIINHQSVAIFLKFLFVEDVYFNPSPVINNYAAYHYILILFKAIIYSFAFIMPFTIKNNNIRFGLWIMFLLLLSPNGSTYSLIILTIPFLVILAENKNNKERLLITVFSFLIINNVPMHLFSTDIIVFKFIRLITLLLLLVFLMKWCYKKIPFLKFALIFILILSLQLLNPMPIKQKGKTIYGGRTIINGFAVVGDKLIVEELDGKEKIKTTILEIEPQDTKENVEIIANQIFVNDVQITNSLDLKKDPVLVNNAILFLSDYHQSYKFYNIRSIPFVSKNNVQ